MKKILVLIIAALVSLGVRAAAAQTMDESMQDMNKDSSTNTEKMDAMEGMDMDEDTPQETSKDTEQDTKPDSMPNMEHNNMDHGSMDGMNHDMNSHTMQGMDQSGMSESSSSMEHSTDHSMHHNAAAMSGGMAGMSHGSMQGGSAPPDARDPHAYSDGLDFGPIPRPRLGDEHSFGSILIDRLEAVHTSDNNSAAYALQGWYGRDYDRAVLKAEGEIDDSKVQEARSQLFWSHAVTAYWNTQLGLRYDSGEEPGRGWLAFGVQGLAPYWFEMDATAYAGEQGRFALNLEAEYELLITQKLILQPRLETDIYSKKDSERGIGSGLSELTAGVRLRYEIRRQFAPYLGVEWTGLFGGTADYARDAGMDTKETRAVAGVRAWF